MIYFIDKNIIEFITKYILILYYFNLCTVFLLTELIT